MNNEWIYPAPHSDTVTILCEETGPVCAVLQGAGKLRINSGYKRFSTSALLQASFTAMSNVSLKGDLLKQIPLQYDCSVELNLKFNLKQTLSHFDGLQCANNKVSELEKEIKEQKWKNHNLLKHNTYSVIGYIFLS